MNTNIKKLVLAGAVALCLVAVAPGPLSAHHSFAEFDTTASKTVTGTVKTVEWTNPHIWIYVDVPNEKGANETYAFEGMSPNFLERRNWTRTTLKAGDKVTVTFNPLRSGKPGGMFNQGRLENGKVLTSGGGR